MANPRLKSMVAGAVLCCAACGSDSAEKPSAAATQEVPGAAPEATPSAPRPAADVAGAASLEPTRQAAAGSGSNAMAERPPAPAAAPASAPAAAGSGSSEPADTRSKPASMPAASPPNTSCDLPAEYTRANRITFEVTWPGTIGLEAGKGNVLMWAKVKYTREPDGVTRLESRACGVVTPDVITTALLGGLRFSTQVPFEVFDSTSIPTQVGQMKEADGKLTIDPGAALVGVSLSDPDGAWPDDAAALMTVDYDGDGAPGLTTIPVEGDDYLKVPTDVSQQEFLDRIYTASRTKMGLSLSASECSDSRRATLVPTDFEYSIVGCHVKDRGECTADEVRFVSGQSPRYKLGTSGTWAEVAVPAEASCADVRAALPPL